MSRLRQNLRVRPWALLTRLTPLLYTSPAPDADQSVFLAYAATTTTSCEPRPPPLGNAHLQPDHHRETVLLPKLPSVMKVGNIKNGATPVGLLNLQLKPWILPRY